LFAFFLVAALVLEALEGLLFIFDVYEEGDDEEDGGGDYSSFVVADEDVLDDGADAYLLSYFGVLRHQQYNMTSSATISNSTSQNASKDIENI